MNMAMSEARMLAFYDFDGKKPPRVRRLAERICEGAFGSWEATGYEIRLCCVKAAEAALLCLDQHGYDLTMLDTEERTT